MAGKGTLAVVANKNMRRSSSKSPARRAAKVATSVEMPSTPKRTARTAKSTSAAAEHLAALLPKLLVMTITSLAILYVVLRFGVITRFVCPLATKLYLTPLGLAGLKSRGLIMLSILWYALVTYILLPTALYLAVPLCTGRQVNTSDPRTQRQSLGGHVQRLANAQLNMVEGFILMLAAVFVGMGAGVTDEKILELVTIFVTSRKAYIVAYTMDCHCARTVTYFIGCFAMLHLCQLGVLKFL